MIEREQEYHQRKIQGMFTHVVEYAEYEKLRHLLEIIVGSSQHADTRIPAEFVDKIRKALKR